MTDIIWNETQAPAGWYRARCATTGNGLPNAATLHSATGPHRSHGEAMLANRGARTIVTVPAGDTTELGRACTLLGEQTRAALLAELDALADKAADHERLREHWTARTLSAEARLRAAKPDGTEAKKAAKSLQAAKDLTRRHDAAAKAARRAHRTRAKQLGMEI